jgi:hypothetical protein
MVVGSAYDSAENVHGFGGIGVIVASDTMRPTTVGHGSHTSRQFMQSHGTMIHIGYIFSVVIDTPHQ